MAGNQQMQFFLPFGIIIGQIMLMIRRQLILPTKPKILKLGILFLSLRAPAQKSRRWSITGQLGLMVIIVDGQIQRLKREVFRELERAQFEDMILG